MKLVTYADPFTDSSRFAFIKNGFVVDVVRAAIWVKRNRGNADYLKIPSTLKGSLANWVANFPKLSSLKEQFASENVALLTVRGNRVAVREGNVVLRAPVPNPSTCRNFCAFEHPITTWKLQGLGIHPDWYHIPIFCFSNPNSLYGDRAEILYPRGTQELDFGLAFAVIIANGGRDILKDEADTVIGGYTICNDWAARDWEREEIQLHLGPAKGKDFATSFGPYLVTPDELADAWADQRLNLRMTCHVNGKLISEGNTGDLYHSFHAMIERASRNADLLPGDYICSGTAGTGSTAQLHSEQRGEWLKKGDVVRLEVERLGVLENTIV